ncbi:hypothetical protein MBLNU459_g1714t2 [Dothideomycetes sp. NU459]
MRMLCANVAGLHQDADGDAVEDDFIHAFDRQSPTESTSGSWEAFALLPSKERLQECISIAVDQGCCLLDFVDRSAVDGIIHRIYDADSVDYNSEDRKSLALLYALLALGRRFEIKKGVAAALRMGLHVSSASEGLSEHDSSVRRCLFSVLNIMDTYVTTALGLPRTLRDVQSDHLLPMADYTSPEASAKLMSDSPTAPLAATHAHAKLILILAKVVQYNQPIAGPIPQKNGHYSVPFTKIAAIENELGSWFNALPHELMLDGDENPHSLRAQLLLRLAYAHVQMVLYRPFLHHATKDLRPSKEIKYKAYACGSACVKAAMQVVWLAEALEARGLFNEANWFVALVVSFAATILMLFVLSNEGDSTINETADAAERIKNILARRAGESPSAKRCSKFLQELCDARSKRASISEAHSHLPDAVDLPSVSSTDGNSGYVSQYPRDASSTAELSDEEEHMLQAMHYPRLHPYLDEF